LINISTVIKSYIQTLWRRKNWFYIALRLNKTCTLGWDAVFEGCKFNALSNTTIESGVNIECSSAKISLGQDCRVRSGAKLLSWGGEIKIGNGCSFNSGVVVIGSGGVSMANNIRVGYNSVIVSGNHNFSLRALPIYQQGINARGVEIEEDVWIGANVTILDGVKIKRGSVIGAGSVVNKSTEEYSVNIGIPARRIRDRI
jgi:acetyltransferase-like isoleucine patch superfamily enzyme